MANNLENEYGWFDADALLAKHRVSRGDEKGIRTASNSKPLELPNPGESIRKRNARVFSKEKKSQSEEEPNPLP